MCVGYRYVEEMIRYVFKKYEKHTKKHTYQLVSQNDIVAKFMLRLLPKNYCLRYTIINQYSYLRVKRICKVCFNF